MDVWVARVTKRIGTIHGFDENLMVYFVGRVSDQIIVSPSSFFRPKFVCCYFRTARP
jgi:hypothetical protein